MSLFLTAQNWRDNLQARIEGFRERIVEVWLGPDEGGLNLWMDAAVLVEAGVAAGVPRGQAGALDLSALLALAHQTFVAGRGKLVEVDASLGEISVRPTY